MFSLILTDIVVIFCIILATLVGVRAWDFFPARLFVLVTGILVLLNIFNSIRTQITNPEIGYFFPATSVSLLALLTMSLLLLISRLFMPQWWRGWYPIFWILLPYAVMTVLVMIDMFARTGWFVDGVRWEFGAYRFVLVQPNAFILLGSLVVGWGVHVVLLIIATFTQPKVRIAAGLLAIALLITIGANTIVSTVELVQGLSNIMSTLPVVGALAYAVLRTRLLTPTRAGIDQAVATMNEVLVITNPDNTVVFANPAATQLGLAQQQPLPDSLTIAPANGQDVHTTTQPLLLSNRQLMVSYVPIHDQNSDHIGTMLLGRDVTEIEQRTEQLAQERERLNTTVQQLESEKRERLQLAATVRAMSVPVIPILDGVLVLPLIGEFDDERIEIFNTVLLKSIEREHAQLVLLDITGLPQLEPQTAAGLIRGVKAARLLGVKCILVGVRPDIAQALISLGISLDDLSTAATLQQALRPIVHTEFARA